MNDFPYLFRLTDIGFWLYFAYFGITICISLYIPGNLITRKLSQSRFTTFTLSWAVGTALWIIQGYIFGYLNIRWATYLYLVATALLWLKTTKFRQPHMPPLHVPTVLLVTTGILLECLNVFHHAYLNDGGMAFSSYNQIGQVAIVDEVKDHIPPYIPGMYGVQIQSYHYFSHLVAAELIRNFQLPLIYTVTHYLHIYIVFLFYASALLIAQLLHPTSQYSKPLNSKPLNRYSAWFLLILITTQDLAPNITTALSIPMLYSAVALFLIWWRSTTLWSSVCFVLVSSVLIGIKVHTGLYWLLGLSIVGLLSLFFTFCQFSHMSKWAKVLETILSLSAKVVAGKIATLLLIGLVALALYLPTNSGSGGLVYAGFWHGKSLATDPRFGFPQSVVDFLFSIVYGPGKAEFIKQSPLQNMIIIIVAHAAMIALFLYKVIGLQLVSLVQTQKSMRSIPSFLHIALILPMILTLIIAMFFTQAKGSTHSAVFIDVISYVLPFYGALALSLGIGQFPSVIQRSIVVLVLLLMTLITFQRIQYAIALYDPKIVPFTISLQELTALKFLREENKQKQLVIVDPNNRLDEVVTYASFFADSPMYYSQRFSVENHGYSEVADRKPVYWSIFSDRDISRKQELLRRHNIHYLYLYPTTEVPLEAIAAKQIFTNEAVTILKTE